MSYCKGGGHIAPAPKSGGDPFENAERPAGSAIASCDTGAAVVAGRDAERRDVVAWLRREVDRALKLAEECAPLSAERVRARQVAAVLNIAVGAIERGAHRE